MEVGKGGNPQTNQTWKESILQKVRSKKYVVKRKLKDKHTWRQTNTKS